MKCLLIVILSLLIVASICQTTVIEEDVTSFLRKNKADSTGSFGDSSIPCSGRDSCGEARSFQNQQQFQQFVQNYTRPTVAAERYSIARSDLGSSSTPSASPAPKIEPRLADLQAYIRTNPNTIQSTNNIRTAPQANLQFRSNKINYTPTTVNNQKIDEADLLKTDGAYIYTISNKILSIVQAYPASSAQVLSTIKIESFTPEAIFIQGNYLALFGTQSEGLYPNTLVKIFDVSNRRRPFLIKEFKVNGKYFDGRKLRNGFMYLISKQKFTFFFQATLLWFDIGFGRSNVPFASIFWYPGVYIQPAGLNIIAFNLGDPFSDQKKVVTICSDDATILYMSERNIYLAINGEFGNEDFTKIRKVYVSRNRIIPFADVKLRGSTNNQFSMDQSQNYLRIATTALKTDRESIFNNVYVLNNNLQPVGTLPRIALNEKIYSCRFFGSRLFIATYRNQNPFFVIGFRNRVNPQILGQLSITGFSRFLYPYDQRTLVGIGRQTDSFGRQLGIKFSVFDISNVYQPRESVKYKFKEQFANSEALTQHKAFLLSPENNILVIPVSLKSSQLNFNGAFIFKITPTTIKLLNAVDHLLQPNDVFDNRRVERSLIIEDNLYTKSKCLIRINEISNYFDEVKDVQLSC